MGVTLYNKKSSSDYDKLIKKCHELYSLHDELSVSIDSKKYMDFYFSIYDEIIGENSYSLRYSEWCNFLEKYVWSFFDELGISTINFNSDDNGTISSKEMKLLLEYLNSYINVKGIDKEIIEFLNKNRKGISYS
jgi:hypothetical protein